MKTTDKTLAIIRAFNALNIPLKDIQWWSCDAPVYQIPKTLPEEIVSWLARHPEAGAPTSDRVHTAEMHARWKHRFQSVAYVLAAPAKNRPAAKRAYRAARN
jgi:hypothetical protein